MMFSPQIDSKFTLGFSGILAVLFSVLSSVGFRSFVHELATLIIIEVVPFLVLAVGVDNIFIVVQAYQHQDQHAEEGVPHKIGPVLGSSTKYALNLFIGVCCIRNRWVSFNIYCEWPWDQTCPYSQNLQWILKITCVAVYFMFKIIPKQ